MHKMDVYQIGITWLIARTYVVRSWLQYEVFWIMAEQQVIY